MDRQASNGAPGLVAILIIALILYVVSYLALIVPGGFHQSHTIAATGYTYSTWECYRLGGNVAYRFFWPLHQIDRTIRPETWN